MRVRVQIQNADPTVLNKIRHLALRNVRISEGEITMTAPLIKQRQLRQILRNYDHTITREPSFLDIFSFFYARLFFVGCLVVAIAVLSILNNFVFRVRIMGLNPEQVSQVTAFLRDSGVRPLTPKGRYRNDAVALTLTREFPFIAHASTQIRRGSLVIHVYQTPNPPPTGEVDLVAQHDAIIEEITVMSGTQMVQVGDSVVAGQILVRAARQIGDFEDGTTDEFGRPIMIPVEVPTRVVAVIRGRITSSASSTIEIADPARREQQIMLEVANLTSAIQASKFGVTFQYSQSFLTDIGGGLVTVEVVLSTMVIDLV